MNFKSGIVESRSSNSITILVTDVEALTRKLAEDIMRRNDVCLRSRTMSD